MKKKKTIKVLGVKLTSGFWWIIKEGEEFKVFRNKGNQRLLLRDRDLARLELQEKRIKQTQEGF